MSPTREEGDNVTEFLFRKTEEVVAKCTTIKEVRKLHDAAPARGFARRLCIARSEELNDANIYV